MHYPTAVYFNSAAEMAQLFNDVPEALTTRSHRRDVAI